MARIVLAEDDQTMVSLLTTLLKMEGFEVSALRPDDDIAEAVNRERPELLILDFLLADQSGLDILDAIRRSDGGGGTKVIMISGLNVRDVCMSHGADEFLLKPFMPEELLSLLRTRTEFPS